MKQINFSELNHISDDAYYFEDKIVLGKARKNLLNTKLFPARASAFTLFVIEKGCMEIGLDYSSYTLTESSFLIILPEHLIKSLDVTDNFEANVIISDQEYFGNIGDNKDKLYQPEFMNIRKCPGFEMTKRELEVFKSCYSRIKQKIIQKHHLKDQIIKVHLMELIIEIYNMFIERGYTSNMEKLPRQEYILYNFLQLLQENIRSEHKVVFYADRLHITPQYLALVLRRLTGKTTREWLANALIIEAKILLKHSQLSVQQISNSLNFCDPSAFGKFFKNMTNVTPFQYRKQ